MNEASRLMACFLEECVKHSGLDDLEVAVESSRPERTYEAVIVSRNTSNQYIVFIIDEEKILGLGSKGGRLEVEMAHPNSIENTGAWIGAQLSTTEAI